MELHEIYNQAKASSDYDTFLMGLGQKIGIPPTDARCQDITLKDICDEPKVLPDDVKNVLLKVMTAYQGVGDFEGTGENMVSVISDVVDIITKYRILYIDYKDDPK